jgi:diketogulonate reductase-like aldo/keto reductase
MGASRPEQVRENAASLDIVLSPEQRAKLDAVGAPPRPNPYFIFDLPPRGIFGVDRVAPWGTEL